MIVAHSSKRTHAAEVSRINDTTERTIVASSIYSYSLIHSASRSLPLSIPNFRYRVYSGIVAYAIDVSISIGLLLLMILLVA